MRVVLDEGLTAGERVCSAAADRWRGKRGTEKREGSAIKCVANPPTKGSTRGDDDEDEDDVDDSEWDDRWDGRRATCEMV